MLAIARAIRTVTTIVVLVIVVGIVLWVLSANQHNAIVGDVHSAARWLVGPFGNVFSVKGAKLDLGINWGVAAVVYAAAGSFLAGLAARASFGRRRFGRARPVA
jgi:hypothetical protein